MGNSECVTRQSNSLNLEHRMTHSPQKSYAEDDVGLEVSDERMKIVTMKQFKYQSLSAVKQNQTRHAIEVKTRHDSYSNNELISKKTKETKDNPIVKLESLKPLKIDPMIFINIKKGKVTENYQMDKLLGEGTYGRVMLVTHKSTDLRRALKSRII